MDLTAPCLAAIPLLLARAQFVVSQWQRLHSEEADADEDFREMMEDVDAIFTESKVREILVDSATRAGADLTLVSALPFELHDRQADLSMKSHLVWDLMLDWELSLLRKAPVSAA